MSKESNYTIENEFLKVIVKPTGAELGSVFNKKNNTELLWQGNAEFWGGQAPILFPIVGELKEGYYTHDRVNYKIPRHGLVRKSSQWEFKQLSKTSLACVFTSNSTTKTQYPFDFKLTVTYTLEENNLKIAHKIANLGTETMPFSIGGHPAFNTPISDKVKYTDYSLEFEKTENSVRHHLDEYGILNGETTPVFNESGTLKLTEDIFNDDALVFKDLKSKVVDLVGPQGSILTVSYFDFPFLGIWAKPGAPFVCIEPWIGHADTATSAHDIFKKEGSIALEAKSEFEASYEILVD